MQKVLILDGNSRSALAATRSLGAKGVHVVVADESAGTLAGSSKYCRESFVYPSPYKHPERFVTTLKSEAAERGIKVIFPMTEISTSLVLSGRGEFGDVRIPFVPFPTFEMLTDKWRLFELARQLGIPIPETYFVKGHEELSETLPRLKFPVVLKPHRSRIWSGERWISASVKYAGSVQETERIVAEHECFRQHPFLLQEYVSGEAQGIFALYDRATPVVFFAHKRLREKPPSGGVSVLSESIETNPRLREIARRILDSVGWHGVAMVEFKVAHDGTPYLMEVNARFWGSLQLAIDAGVDFPWLLYQLAQGEVPEKIDNYTTGIRSRWLLGDCAHLYRVLSGNGEGNCPARLARWRSFAGFCRFFESNTRYEVNRWDDLRPFVFELKQLVWK